MRAGTRRGGGTAVRASRRSSSISKPGRRHDQAVDEQFDRRRLVERRQRHSQFPWDSQRQTAGGQEVNAGTLSRQCLYRRLRRGDDSLTVVEHEQTPVDHATNRSHCPAAIALARGAHANLRRLHCQRCRHRCRQGRRSRHRRGIPPTGVVRPGRPDGSCPARQGRSSTTTRSRGTRSVNRSSSSARPRNLVAHSGSWTVAVPVALNAGNARSPTWYTRSGVARSLSRCSPRSVNSAVSSSCAVAADSRIWPPCPAAISRAARFIVGPK